MLVPFLKKNATELDFLHKITSRYPELPFNYVFSLLALFNNRGLEDLNSSYKDSTQQTDRFGKKGIKDNVEHFLRKEYPDFENLFGTEIPEEVSDACFLTTKLNPENKLSFKISLQFATACVHSRFDFKTPLVDIFEIVTPAVKTVLNRGSVLKNLKKYVKATSVIGDNTEVMLFSDLKDLEAKIILAVIKDPEIKKTFTFIHSVESKFVPPNAPIPTFATEEGATWKHVDEYRDGKKQTYAAKEKTAPGEEKIVTWKNGSFVPKPAKVTTAPKEEEDDDEAPWDKDVPY